MCCSCCTFTNQCFPTPVFLPSPLAWLRRPITLLHCSTGAFKWLSKRCLFSFCTIRCSLDNSSIDNYLNKVFNNKKTHKCRCNTRKKNKCSTIVVSWSLCACHAEPAAPLHSPSGGHQESSFMNSFICFFFPSVLSF